MNKKQVLLSSHSENNYFLKSFVDKSNKSTITTVEFFEKPDNERIISLWCLYHFKQI